MARGCSRTGLRHRPAFEKTARRNERGLKYAEAELDEALEEKTAAQTELAVVVSQNELEDDKPGRGGGGWGAASLSGGGNPECRRRCAELEAEVSRLSARLALKSEPVGPCKSCGELNLEIASLRAQLAAEKNCHRWETLAARSGVRS